jgi:hypothetical protein
MNITIQFLYVADINVVLQSCSHKDLELIPFIFVTFGAQQEAFN